jgi:phosphoribosylformylglycinamidine synthase
MILFFKCGSGNVIAAGTDSDLPVADIEKLSWLFGNAPLCEETTVKGIFVGPRKEMITPWSTNAVEITQNMGIRGIIRIEEFFPSETSEPRFDPMLQAVYRDPGQDIFLSLIHI